MQTKLQTDHTFIPILLQELSDPGLNHLPRPGLREIKGLLRYFTLFRIITLFHFVIPPVYEVYRGYIVIPPVYEVYRGYIVFAFSVCV